MFRPSYRSFSLLAALLMGTAIDADAQTSSAAETASTPSENSLRADTMNLTTSSGVLHGTLLLPASAEGRLPVVLLISGSGPTDRDGNSPLLTGANNSLKLLAEALATKGIASVRYDKRGIGESQGTMAREADLRFDMYVDDAVGWTRRLRADPRFSSVTIVGHSEGSLIGMLAAARAEASGFVSIAGAGRPAQDILREQFGRQLPPAMLASAERGIAALAAGRLADSTPPELASLFRPSVQPYLISWFRYDPAKEIARLRVPVLIAQGTTDMQVALTDAQRLASALPGARLLVIEGMNHVLKAVSADAAEQRRSYGDPGLPVVPRLVDAIAELVRQTR